MFELTVKSSFSGAHHLAGYKGSCSGHHGHNWDVEAALTGNELNEIGIIVDYRVLKVKLKEILDLLDHRDLNTIPQFEGRNPSSENIAKFIYEAMQTSLKGLPCRMSYVRVYETPLTSAIYRDSGND